MNDQQSNKKSKAIDPEMYNNSLLADADVAIIGGGVVGCAVARRMALEGASVVLVEKGADILGGASKGNSAILHTGFDTPEDSLELECVRNGYDEYLEIRKSLNLPVLKSGIDCCLDRRRGGAIRGDTGESASQRRRGYAFTESV